MSFFDHFDELRERMMRVLLVFCIVFLLAYFFATNHVMNFLRAPLFEIMPPDQHKLYFTSLFENFMAHLKMAAVTAIFVIAPYIFYEFWAFLAPGLYPKERKLALPFVAATTFFFFAGAGFAYYVLFPVAFKFFVTYGMPSDTPILTIDAYYGTCLKLLLLFGAAFELPVLVALLGALGVIDAPFLKKQRRMAILGITIACAMFAPPDAISMIMLMIPLILLYEAAIIVVSWMDVKRRVNSNNEAEEEAKEEKRSKTPKTD